MSNATTSSKTDPARAGTASGTMQGMAQSVAEQGRAAMESVTEHGRSALDTVGRTSMTTYASFRDQVERNPVTSVLSAVAVGFVLGVLWRSPPRSSYGMNVPSRAEMENWFNDLMRSASKQLNRHYSSATGSGWRWW